MSTISSKIIMRGVVAGALLLCIGVQLSWAWGREGHRLTALVAEQYLTPEAKSQVALLLGKETLADVAPWADSYREEHPETGKWHFVDIPRSENPELHPMDEDLSLHPSAQRSCAGDPGIAQEAFDRTAR